MDQFSFTAASHPWIAHEWLSQLVTFAAFQAGGYQALMLAFCVVASLIVVLSYVICGLWSGNWKVSLVGAMAAFFFLTVSLAIRPLLLGHLFLLVEFLLLYYGFVRKSAAIWALPLLFVIWANCHGSFIFGAVVAALTTVGVCWRFKGWWPRLAVDRRLAIRSCVVLGLCLLAPFVNPVGPELVLYPLNVLGAQPDNIGNIEEWAALNPTEPRGIGLALMLGVIVLVCLVSRKRPTAYEWLALLGTTAMALRHSRMLPLFGFIAAPLMCRLLADAWENYDPRKDRPIVNALMMLAALAFSIAVLPSTRDIQKQIAAKEPVKATHSMNALGLSGPVLNDYAWGGYLMWANRSQPVFIDGRADIYAWTGVLRDFGRWALLQEDPRLLLDRYKIQTCLIRTSSPMANVLPYLPGWKKVYSDDLAVVFTRSSAAATP
ncbi:MAG: hypothetical protein ABI823_07750 [Bryobacteraceae bacterium]